MKKLLTLFILSCILFGCKKSSEEDENYTISGFVLDFDSNVAIAGAKVYVKEREPFGVVVDSAISDANGRVSFTLTTGGGHKFLFPTKANYLNAINLIVQNADYNDRTDNLYLARPSFVNVTLHKTGSYLPSDTVDVHVLFDYVEPFQNNYNRTLYRDKANGLDKTFNLQAVYGHLMGDLFFGTKKLYFNSDVLRNGIPISSKTDSINVIQFGTQNFTYNY